MDYKIVVTKDAEEDLDRFIQYLIFEKKSMQAAQNVLDDYDATIDCLKHVAGSLKLCENPALLSTSHGLLRGSIFALI